MEKQEAINVLQGSTFEIEETFYSELAGDVIAEYTVNITEACSLIEYFDINLKNIKDEIALTSEVQRKLDEYVISGNSDIEGVEAL